METAAVDKRMDDFMNHDWRSEAAAILEDRKRGHETQHQTEKAEGGKLGLFEL